MWKKNVKCLLKMSPSSWSVYKYQWSVARLVQAWKGHCVYRLHFISETIHCVLFVILGVIVFLRGAGVNLLGGTVQWWQWCVQTVKAERKPPSAAAAHSTAYIFPIGPLSCHLELLKVTLLHGCIYKEIPHSGSVSRGKRRPPSLNSCVTLQAKPSASQVRPSKYWCYTKLQSNSFYQSEPNQQVGFK